MDLLARLLGSPVADTAISHALRLEDPWPSWPPDEMLAVLSPIQWFLDRAYDGGIPLTSAGYPQRRKCKRPQPSSRCTGVKELARWRRPNR